MESTNLQLEALEARSEAFDFAGIFDDDRWFAPGYIDAELPTALARDDIDLWNARSIFFEDAPNLYNPAREHHSVAFFRHRDGDRFPPSALRIIQATSEVHDSAIISRRVADLTTPLLDYGTYFPSDRSRVHNAYAAAGVTDRQISSLSARRTRLAVFPHDARAAGLLPAYSAAPEIWIPPCPTEPVL